MAASVVEAEVAVEPQQPWERPMTVVASVDEGSVDASPDLADKGCDSQRQVDDQVHVDIHEVGQDGSSADRVACDARKDIVGILVDTEACDHRTAPLEVPVDILDTSHEVVAANENLAFQLLDDVE